MPRRATIAAALLVLLGAAPAAAAENRGVLLAVEPGYGAAKLVAAEDGRLVSASLGIWLVDAGAARRLVPALRQLGLLRYSAPDRVRTGQALPGAGDPLVRSAWQLERVGAAGLEPPGPGVPVNVVDSLVDRTYPELADRPDVTILSDHTDCAGFDTPHATAVAAIAAAPANGVGTVGVYPTASLWSTNACNLEDSDIIAAIDEAIARGPSVITLSLGAPGYSRPLYEAILRAVGTGSLVVAAAGNDRGSGNPAIYPGAYPHVLTIGSSDRRDAPSAFSGSSSNVDLVAPGEDIPLLDPQRPGSATTVTGTSYATSIVAAAAAWVWTARREVDPTQVSELLRRSARDVGRGGFDVRTGFGRLDLAAALAGSAPAPDPQEPNDDVDLVSAGGVFAVAKSPLAAGTVLTARVDRREDPRDVYRVTVPAGERLTVTAAANARIGISVWRPRTRSVLESGRAARRDRLVSARAEAGRPATLAYVSTSGRSTVVYVAVRPLRAARASYELELSR